MRRSTPLLSLQLEGEMRERRREDFLLVTSSLSFLEVVVHRQLVQIRVRFKCYHEKTRLFTKKPFLLMAGSLRGSFGCGILVNKGLI